MTNDVRIWGMHTGRHGEAETLFLNQKRLGIRDPLIGDLSQLKADRETFKAEYANRYPQCLAGAVPVHAGVLFRFVHEMQSGDLVVVPAKRERKLYLGRISGGYDYVPSEPGGYVHQRPVDWIRSVPRTEFSQGALYEVGSAITLFRIKNYTEEFRAAATGEVLGPAEDFRAQITREDILAAMGALDRGEPNGFGPSTFYDILEEERRYPPKAVVGLAARRALGRPLRPDEFSGGDESWAFRLLRERGFTIVRKVRSDDAFQLPQTPPAPVWIEDTRTAAHGHGGPGWEFGLCLWRPSANEVGSDWYSIMREPKSGDVVIHFNDGDIVG